MNFGNGRFDRTIARKRKSAATEDNTDNGLMDVELEDGNSEPGCQTGYLLVTHVSLAAKKVSLGLVHTKIYATHLFMPTELHSGNDGPSMF